MVERVGARWRERLANWLFGDVIEARLAEAVSFATEDIGWRSMAGVDGDVPLSLRLEHLRDSAEAYRVNPIAYRLVELMTDFVLGKGVTLECSDSRVASWLRAWWAHPQNRMGLRAFELCTQLTLAGELFVAYHRNPIDGVPYVRPIAARYVDQVETDPEDMEREVRYHRIPAGQLVGLGQVQAVAPAGVSGGVWLPAADPYQAPDGEAVGPWVRHYAVNRVDGAVRGTGDLVTLLPWLRRYKDWLTDRVRINRFKGAFLWDVKVSGGPAAVASKRAELAATPPEPGSFIVHNEAEEWASVQPRIGGDDVSADGRAIRLMLAVGAGLPLHYLSEGEGTNRATAAEQGTPTLRHFERRQLYFGHLLADMGRTAVTLSRQFPGVAYELTARFEDLTTTDNMEQAGAASRAARALAVAQENGWVDTVTAARLFLKFIGEPVDLQEPDVDVTVAARKLRSLVGRGGGAGPNGSGGGVA